MRTPLPFLHWVCSTRTLARTCMCGACVCVCGVTIETAIVIVSSCIHHCCLYLNYYWSGLALLLRLLLSTHTEYKNKMCPSNWMNWTMPQWFNACTEIERESRENVREGLTMWTMNQNTFIRVYNLWKNVCIHTMHKTPDDNNDLRFLFLIFNQLLRVMFEIGLNKKSSWWSNNRHELRIF